MKKIETGKLLIVKNIAANLAYLKIKIEGNGENYAPGNFVTILPPISSGRYLRRPFSVAGNSDGSIELIIKNIGSVTESLISLTEGTELELLGPLGNSYQIPENIKKLWMIGGGTGIASILFLNSLRSGNSAYMDKVLWAGKTKEALPSMELFTPQSEIFRKNIAIATDDGSAGEKGRAPEILMQWLEKENNPDGIVSCGPREMMKEINKIADKRGIPAWLSMEEFVACGSGACAGCVVPSPYGSRCSSSFLKVCTDGPVFKSSEVIL
ncbi:MAG: FAD-binding oxidoreductase [Spirochaetaceae bacterium]|nr:FAD-binding oxidoreductase [Spirochaetaceae bacterium]